VKPQRKDAAGAPETAGPALELVPSEPALPGLSEAELPELEARRIDLAWAAVMVGVLAALFLLISLFAGVAVPVLLSLALAYVFNPVVTWLERRGWDRTWGTTAVFAVMALLFAGLVVYLVPVFREEAAKLPEFFRKGSAELLPRIEKLTGLSLPELVRQRAAELGGEASDLARSVGPAVAKLAAAFAGNTARLVTTILGLFIVPVIGFFFLRDYPSLLETAKNLIPRRAVGLVSRRFSQVDEVLSAFVQGQITVGAVLSVIYSAGLSAARIDMAILIGLIAGFGNMVPYLGTGVGIVLAAVGLALSWQGAWQLAVVVGTFVVAQALEGFVITPRLVGEKVGLSSVVVILAILAFGELFGFVGILLAVPVAAILKVVGSVVIERYRRTRLYEGSPKST
jgi:predicted PurR-regulated permease PerM